MKTRIILTVALVFLVALGVQLIVVYSGKRSGENAEPVSPAEEKQSAYHYLRWKYEADMIKDPVTGQVPVGLRVQEIEFAKTIPERNTSSLARTSALNTYFPAGPNNNGGRTRAIAYDVRYNGTTNKRIIAGGISGGLFRSEDGGENWTRVTPLNEVHNVSSVAQDPRAGFQNIWYAGGGEPISSSTDAIGAGYLSHGLFKSTDDGATWVRLPLNNITDHLGNPVPAGVAERFDHPFDYVHKIAVNPQNGDVYVASHRRVVRSSNQGTTFQTVFGSAVSSFAANGQCDVVISSQGKIFIAYNGSAPDFN